MLKKKITIEHLLNKMEIRYVKRNGNKIVLRKTEN